MQKILTLNSLNGHEVTSDRADKNTLAKFRNKLDSVCIQHKILRFSELIDYSHLSFERGEIPYREGISSNDEFMAEHGKWFDAGKVYNQLSDLRNEVQRKPMRFGFLKNHYDQVLLELDECIKFTKMASNEALQVNFSEVIVGEWARLGRPLFGGL